MLKNVLSLDGIEILSRNEQSSILGGVDRCCLFPPPNGLTNEGCNPHPACADAACAC